MYLLFEAIPGSLYKNPPELRTVELLPQTIKNTKDREQQKKKMYFLQRGKGRKNIRKSSKSESNRRTEERIYKGK